MTSASSRWARGSARAAFVAVLLAVLVLVAIDRKGTRPEATCLEPAALPGSARELSRLAAYADDTWYEIHAGGASLLGRSFRVLVNARAAAWIRGDAPLAPGVELLKLNRDQLPETAGDNWEDARFESVRFVGGCVATSAWAFYSFGPMRDAAEATAPQSSYVCLDCHRRVPWRGEPLFLSLYLDDRSVLAPSILRIAARDGSRTVEVHSSRAYRVQAAEYPSSGSPQPAQLRQ